MNILLVQPPVRDFYMTPRRTEPLGLAYISASLKKHGHCVEILDCLTDEKKSLPLPAELACLKEYYPFDDKSPFKLYTGFYHFGMSYEKIEQRLRESRADVFGISSNFTPYFYEALEVAKIIKRLYSDRPVVMGGCHVSSNPEGVMQHSGVDYIVLGEGEERFPRLLDHLNRGRQIDDIDGIGYRLSGKVVIRPMKEIIRDVDGIPLPERGIKKVKGNKKQPVMLITSRGCPHACEYCSAFSVMGRKFRARTPGSVVSEMKRCADLYGAGAFDFEDDNFSFDKTRARELLLGIIDAFGEGTIELSAMNGISYASLDADLLALMKRAGFKTINLSFVSTEEFIKEQMKRPNSAISFESIVEDAVSLGLQVIAYGIFGMPRQTIPEMLDTVIHLMGLPVLIGPSFFYPSPGTPLFDLCSKEGYLSPFQQQWRSSAMSVETENFSRRDLITIFRITRLVNYLKAMISENRICSGTTIKDIAGSMESQFLDKVESLATPMGLLHLFFQERAIYKLIRKKGSLMNLEKVVFSSEITEYFIRHSQDKPVR